MFAGCTSLTGSDEDEKLEIPNVGSESYCADMFTNSGITPPHNPPIGGDLIPIKRG
jgi:hypothetical protein